MRWRFGLFLMAAALLGIAATARAGTQSVTYSVWDIDGSDVRVRFVLPVDQAQLLIPETPRLDSARAAAAAGKLLSVTSAAGDCAPLIQDQWVGEYYVLAPEDGAHRFEITFRCPTATGIVLHNRVLFDKRPDHIDYARVQVGRGAPALHLFTRDHQETSVPANGATHDLGPFAVQGLDLLRRDFTAVALVIGLLLLARRRRDLISIASALMLGYAVAFVAIWSSMLAPNIAFAGAGMGLAAAVLGLCALSRRALEQPAPCHRAGIIGAALAGVVLIAAVAAKGEAALLTAIGLVIFGFGQASTAVSRSGWITLSFAPALLFGMLDGTAWVQRLVPLQLPGRATASALLGYELGAFAGLVTAVGLSMALLWLLGDRLRALRPLGVDFAAATLTGLGLFWFVSRLYAA